MHWFTVNALPHSLSLDENIPYKAEPLLVYDPTQPFLFSQVQPLAVVSLLL
jgi:hypothetical protein